MQIDNLILIIAAMVAVGAGMVAGLVLMASNRRRHRDTEVAHVQALQSERDVLVERLAARDARLHELRADVATSSERCERLGREARAADARAAEYQALLLSEREMRDQRERELAATGERLAAEFEALAERVLARREADGRARLDALLAPLRGQLDDFRRRVDEVHDAETRERASLHAELRNLQQASERMNQEAIELTRALKGDQRAQGAWGELVLERVLEASGLRHGHEFEVQVAGRDADGQLQRPDVVVRLPGGRHVVVDAKVSLVAWERATAATNDAERARALHRHARDLREQVKRLASKDYARLPQLQTPDFVLLFVPIEGALSAALTEDATLVGDAFARGVMLVSPTTLLMALRVIENLWRRDQADRNAREIAARAGAIYEKLRLLVEDFERLGTQIDGLQRTWDGAAGKLWSGRGNLVTQTEALRGLGADVRRELPRSIVDRAGSDTPAEGD